MAGKKAIPRSEQGLICCRTKEATPFPGGSFGGGRTLEIVSIESMLIDVVIVVVPQYDEIEGGVT